MTNKITTPDTDLDAFTRAVDAHHLALAMFGEDDPRTIEALLAVMALAPDDVFAELENMARSTFH